MTTGVRAREIGRATAELSLLMDIGSAWTKAAVVGRADGRWRIAAHAAQPSAWDELSMPAPFAFAYSPKTAISRQPVPVPYWEPNSNSRY